MDILTPDGIAVDVRDAVTAVSCPVFVGRLVELLITKGLITGDELQALLPPGYEVRT